MNRVVRLGLILVPEGRHIFPNLTVLENLQPGAYIESSRALIKERMDKAFSLFPRLKERQKQKGVPSRAANNRCRQLVGP